VPGGLNRRAFSLHAFTVMPSKAFSSEVDSGSRKENASKQKAICAA
jgi:hypothetical protein